MDTSNNIRYELIRITEQFHYYKAQWKKAKSKNKISYWYNKMIDLVIYKKLHYPEHIKGKTMIDNV